MSLLSRLFGSKNEPPRPSGADLEKRLSAYEAQSESAHPGFKGTPLNKAGDVALRAGVQVRAVQYYGRAIDAFLEDSQPEAARGVANKIIRVYPQAVRTLCTLTWLVLAARHMATALLHLRDYVEAAKGIGEHEIASDQIYAMARIAPQTEFLAAAADALDSLDFGERARRVRDWMAAEGSPEVVTDEDELATRCVHAAAKSNSRSSPTKD